MNVIYVKCNVIWSYIIGAYIIWLQILLLLLLIEWKCDMKLQSGNLNVYSVE